MACFENINVVKCLHDLSIECDYNINVCTVSYGSKSQSDLEEIMTFYAIDNEYLDVIRYILSICPGLLGVSITNAVLCEKMNVLKYLSRLSHEKDIYDNALLSAISFNSIDYVKCLISYGADVNAYRGEPLRLAIEYDHKDILLLLVENGANIRDDDDYALR